MLESKFQADLIEELEALFPGCMILHNDPNYIQGIPDLLVLFEDKWAALESKAAFRSHRRPNQPYYIERMNNMSFSSFISPDNKDEVLHELQRTFGTRGKTRATRR